MDQYVSKEGFLVTAIRFKDDADVISAIAEEIFHDQVFRVDYNSTPPILLQYHGDHENNPNVHLPDSDDRKPPVILCARDGDYIVRDHKGRISAMSIGLFVNQYRPYMPERDHRGVTMSISLTLVGDMLCRELGLPEGSFEVHDIATHGWRAAASFVIQGNLPEFPVVPEGRLFPHAYPVIKVDVIEDGESLRSVRRIEKWDVQPL